MSRRRQTLASLRPSQINNRDGKSSRRLSFMPTKPKNREQKRQSMGAPLKRQSMGPPKNSRMSMGGNVNRRQSISRRSSIYGKSKVQDTRPIGDRAFTQQCIKHLISFLSSHYYDRPLSPKLLQVPTKKDFQHIVAFLFRQIDPLFEFGDHFEEEVRNFLKSFGYPFSISKSSLTAVGSPHTWPTLLAALIWIVQIIEYAEEISEMDGSEEKDEAKACQQMFYNYCKESYRSFLEGNDSYDELDAELGRAFDEKNKASREEIDRFKQENKELRAEVIELTNTQSRIDTMEKKKVNFLNDVAKFRKLAEATEAHKSALQKNFKEREALQLSQRSELQKAQEEIKDLTEEISNQEISYLEVKQMGHERKILEETLEGLSKQKNQIQESIWSEEMQLCQTTSAIDMLTQEYNQLASSLGLAAPHANNANGIKFEIEVNTAASEFKDMCSVDLKSTVKPALAEFKSQLSAKTMESTQLIRAAQRRHKTAEGAKREQQEKIDMLDARLHKLEDLIASQKQGMRSEIKQLVASVEDAELQTHRLRASKTARLQSSQQLLHQMDERIEEEQRAHAAAMEAMREEIEEAMNAITEHQMRLNGGLRELTDVSASALQSIVNLGQK